MSLLLDALKKAAEQKAAKSRQEASEAGSSDETVTTPAGDDTSLLVEQADSTQTVPRDFHDETHIDATEMQTRVDPTHVGAEEVDATEMQTRVETTQFQGDEVDATEMQTRVETTQFQDDEVDATEMQTRVDPTHVGVEEEDATEMQTRIETTQYETDEADATEMQTRVDVTHADIEEVEDTDLEYTESTQTQPPAAGDQVQGGEDDTIIFDKEDVSDFLGDPGLVSRGPEDTTDINQTADDTDLSDLSQRGGPVPDEDDTDISGIFHRADQTEVGEAANGADKTDFTQQELSADGPQRDQTITDVQTEHDASDIASPANSLDDEDMSLLLVDRDDTNLTLHKEITDQRIATDSTAVTQPGADGTEGLSLVDNTQTQVPEDLTETSVPTSAGATVTQGLATQTHTQEMATRMDSTSTRTYAPDNYDRTLMKLPSDDASRIFAGMKSESDVVMTPDYAKKVFRSKSSAQRMQSYKVYSGIVLVILLAIGVFGTFEFQQQSSDIDTSLRPLKRDPMPGVIQPKKPEQDTGVFAETGADTRILEIIESAEDGMAVETETAEEIAEAEEVAVAEVEAEAAEAVESEEIVVADQGVIAGQGEELEEVAGVESTTSIDSAASAPDSPEPAQSAEPVQQESVASTQTATSAQQQAAAAEPEAEKGSLEIITSNQIEQKDLWLREAYAAYKAGDTTRALTRYNQVLEADPTNRNALLARAAINVQNNNTDAAIRDYRALLLLNPKDTLAMTSLIAVANLSPQETESQLKLMIRDDPNSPYLNFALANAYGAQQRWQEAQGYYFKALGKQS